MPDRSARVLIVAPSEYDASAVHPPLTSQAHEVSELVRTFFQPVTLLGRVIDADIASAVRGRPFDGFWFIGHATATGIALSDRLLPVRALGQYLAKAGVIWSYLNTCDSGAFVEQLQAIHAHDAYANIAAINDADAARNGVLLAQSIADVGRIQRAYSVVAAGGASSLRYFPSPNGVGVSVRDPELEKRLARLERVVLGDSDLGVPSWMEQSRRVESRLRRLEWSLIVAVVIIVAAAVVAVEVAARQRPEATIRVATPTPTIYFSFPGDQP